MKNKLAIFDLDGTLFDTSLVNYHSYKKALNIEGYDIEEEYFCKYCNGRHYKDYLSSIVSEEAVLERIHSNKKIFYKNFVAQARVNTHLFELIELMKHEYNIVLVTTASKDNAYMVLDHFNKRRCFDLILTQEDIKKKKPDPEGFIKAMEYYSADKKNTIIFEDADVGIVAARKTGSAVFKIESF